MSKEYSDGNAQKKPDGKKSAPKNKKIILIAVICVVVLAIVTSVVIIAVKNKNNPAANAEGNGIQASGSAADSVNTQGNVKQPVIEGGTAVIDCPSKNSEGKEVTATKVTKVEDFVNQIFIGDTLDTLTQAKKDRFVARFADFGISKATAEEMVKDGTTWMEFSINIYVANSDKKSVSMSMVNATAGDGLYIDKQLGSEYGIPSGKAAYVTIDGILDASKYATEEEALETLKGMNVKLVYTVMENSADSVDDWSQVTTAYMPVKF